MIMNMSIEKMLSHVYEIEGLMLVTRRLGEENTPDVITNKIHRKVRELAEMCGIDLTPAAPVADKQPAAAEPAADVERLPDKDYDADETWQHDNGEEFNEVFKVNYEEPEHQAGEVPVADREPDEDITVEFIESEEELQAPVEDDDRPAAVQPPVFSPGVTTPPAQETITAVQPPVFVKPDDTSDEPVPEPDPAVLPEADDEPDITVEFVEADDEALPEPEDMPVPPVPTEFPEPDEPSAPLRVDEKLQRSLSKDIRKAFSLNDRFRFQRELFQGSSSMMDTAIEHIEAMRSYGNAELYFFTQLGWDRDNEVVQDFMNIVRNHFHK